MRLVAAARKEQLSLTFANIFKNPRLDQLAGVVTETKAENEHLQIRQQFSLIEKTICKLFFRTP